MAIEKESKRIYINSYGREYIVIRTVIDKSSGEERYLIRENIDDVDVPWFVLEPEVFNKNFIEA